MNKLFASALLVFSFVFFVSNSSAKTSRFQVSGELAGGGIIGGLFTSYRPIDYLAVNLGFTYFRVSTDVDINESRVSSSKVGFLFVPVSVSWLTGGKHNFELSAGANIYNISETASSGIGSNISDEGTKVSPFLFAGYRLWKRQMEGASFHLRAGLYGFVFPEGILPWPGVALGVSF